MREEDELNLLAEFSRELRDRAVKFADDAISFAKDVAKNVRNFKYFCIALVMYSVVFAALGFYFMRIPENFIASLSLLVLCGINVLYAFLLWRDYAKTVEKYRYLVEAEKDLEKIKEEVRELEAYGAATKTG